MPIITKVVDQCDLCKREFAEGSCLYLAEGSSFPGYKVPIGENRVICFDCLRARMRPDKHTVLRALEENNRG